MQAKIETRALKAKRPGFSDERYNETEYYFENGKSLLTIRIPRALCIYVSVCTIMFSNVYFMVLLRYTR